MAVATAPLNLLADKSPAKGSTLWRSPPTHARPEDERKAASKSHTSFLGIQERDLRK